MKKSKPKGKEVILKYVGLALITVIVLLIIFVWTYNSFTKSRERNQFKQLEGTLKVLQTKLNQINPTWVYNSGCRGKGGVYERNEPSSCFVQLSNTRTTLEQSEEKFNEYVRAVSKYFMVSSKQSNTKWSLTNESDDRRVNSIGFKYSKDDEVRCVLDEFFISDDPKSTDGGVRFSCNKPATEFLYSRYDI